MQRESELYADSPQARDTDRRARQSETQSLPRLSEKEIQALIEQRSEAMRIQREQQAIRSRKKIVAAMDKMEIMFGLIAARRQQ